MGRKTKKDTRGQVLKAETLVLHLINLVMKLVIKQQAFRCLKRKKFNVE